MATGAALAGIVLSPAELDPALVAACVDAYTVGFSAALLAAAALCLGAAALAWFVLPRSRGNVA
jgi:hypothetical protein